MFCMNFGFSTICIFFSPYFAIALTDVFPSIFVLSIYLYFHVNFLFTSSFCSLDISFITSIFFSFLLSFSSLVFSFSSTILLNSIMFFSLLNRYTYSSQSKYVFDFFTKFKGIFCAPPYISSSFCLFSNAFCKSFSTPVIIIFSFALVNATYKSLISSDSSSVFDFIFIASFAIVLYSIFLSKFIYLGPNPISWSNSICSFKSCILNCLPAPLKNTIGNSNPLLL